jgi:NAD dependent epimerase/dehydratase
MKWAKCKVLVTGGCGFIGSHLVEKLAGLGAEVCVLAHYNSQNRLGQLEALPDDVKAKIRVVWGDIKEAEAVEKAAQNARVIFHLAALVGIPYSYQQPQDVVMTNVIGTLNILKYARDNAVEKVVVTSTSEVYGTARYVPIDEDHPLQGQSPYSASKIGADKIAESFYRAYDLPVAICRPFNTYGPRQSMRAVIPTIITQALYRNEIRLGDTSPTRDFTFVEDTVAGFISIAESPRAVGEAINIGSGFEISIADLAAKVCQLTGRQVPVISEEARKRPEKSEVNRLFAANKKALERLGWKPQVPLDEGLKRTIKWITAARDNFQPDRYYV